MTNKEVKILCAKLANEPEDVVNDFIELIKGRTVDEIRASIALAGELLQKS